MTALRFVLSLYIIDILVYRCSIYIIYINVTQTISLSLSIFIFSLSHLLLQAHFFSSHHAPTVLSPALSISLSLTHSLTHTSSLSLSSQTHTLTHTHSLPLSVHSVSVRQMNYKWYQPKRKHKKYDREKEILRILEREIKIWFLNH